MTKDQSLQRMKADLQLRGLSKHTQESYLRHARLFLEKCGRPVDALNEEDIRRFLHFLIEEKKFMPATVNIYSAAIRFFFAVTLNRTMNYLQIPRMKEPKSLPTVLTRDEAGELIAACDSLKHKAFFLLAYGSGLRVDEIASLRAKDIHSDTMRVFVRGGKGKKDRYTILSETALRVLRDYWRKYRPKSSEGYMFPGGRSSGGHIASSTINRALEKAQRKTNISKDISPHTFRHAFATHLLEDGLNLLQIKELMGHTCMQSTTVYLHLANTTAGIVSPADSHTEKIENCPL